MVNEARDIIDNVKYRFTNEIEKNNLIKRVIGVEGDIVDIKDGSPDLEMLSAAYHIPFLRVENMAHAEEKIQAFFCNKKVGGQGISR